MERGACGVELGAWCLFMGGRFTPNFAHSFGGIVRGEAGPIDAIEFARGDLIGGNLSGEALRCQVGGFGGPATQVGGRIEAVRSTFNRAPRERHGARREDWRH